MRVSKPVIRQHTYIIQYVTLIMAIMAHNHPSGMATPSVADEDLTKALKQSLAMVDVRVLDHFIVAGTSEPLSFAEHGLL